MSLPPLRDPELALSLAYAPAPARKALEALWRLDERLAAIVVEPNRPIAAIKLAWWREALERLDTAPPPPEPLLAALAAEAVSHGISGQRLAGLAGAWDLLIDDDPDDSQAAGEGTPGETHVRARAGSLFGIAADLLGGAGSIDVAAAGMLWALATVPPGFPVSQAEGRALASPASAAIRWPRRLRALGVLTVLARGRLRHPDRPAGSPRRVARALWLAISGY